MLTTVGLWLLAIVTALVAALVATFVWSSDADRRGRAREMLALLLTRAPQVTSSSATPDAGLRPLWVEDPCRALDGGARSAAASANRSEVSDA